MSFGLLSAQADILDIRIGQHKNFTRIVVDMSAATPYHAFTLATPPRLVIDFPEMHFAQRKNNNFDSIPLVNNIRFGRFRAGLTRMVIDMNDHFALEKFFIIPKSDTKPLRFVFDIIKANKTTAYTKKSDEWDNLIEDEQQKARQKRQEQVASTQNEDAVIEQKPFIVIIDPGHGGVDPGAAHKHSGNNVYEKNITLSLAKKVQETINKENGAIKILLTRDDDFFIPLRERFRIAEEVEADLFISLHADSIANKKLRGASVYTLSEKASDEESAALAKKENLSDIYAGQVAFSDDEVVQSILLDLSQRNTMQEGSYFAKYLIEGLKGKTKLLNKPHRHAGFAVLKSPVIPSVLIEAGFLSNEQDAVLLQSKKFHTLFANAVAQALQLYIKRLDEIQKN